MVKMIPRTTIALIIASKGLKTGITGAICQVLCCRLWLEGKTATMRRSSPIVKLRNPVAHGEDL